MRHMGQELLLVNETVEVSKELWMDLTRQKGVRKRFEEWRGHTGNINHI